VEAEAVPEPACGGALYDGGNETASTQAELDGFLVDYAAKGTRSSWRAWEKVEDRDTYKLS